MQEFRNDTSSGVSIEVDESNSTHFTGTIAGPDNTVYDGGVFKVDINIPAEYPFAPPKMKFITKGVLEYTISLLFTERAFIMSFFSLLYQCGTRMCPLKPAPSV